MKTLTKHSLFRCLYHVEATGDCQSIGGRRMTVVADSIEAAIERVTSHELECGTVKFREVVREGIEVWS